MSRHKYIGLVPGTLDSGRGLSPGEIVNTTDLADTDLERSDIVAVQVPGAFDASNASDEQIAEWLEQDKPTVQAVIDAARDQPDTASRLLDAEKAGQARTTAVAGLEAIVNTTPEETR